jgi:prolyl oligopeptidase
LRLLLLVGAVVLMSTAAPPQVQAESLAYPKTQRIDQVDDYHGTRVADPYRWLEDDVRTSEEVAAWVKAENKLTFDYLRKLPRRQAIVDRLTQLWDFEKLSPPSRHGGRYFQTRNSGLQNQSVVYTMKTLEEEPRILLDPNQWAEDGTVALAGSAVSEDGSYFAYGVAKGGSDWRTWHVLEIDTGKVLPDKVEWVKFSSATWSPDSKGFFYGRYDAPEEGAAFQKVNLNQELYYHRIGTSQEQDVLVYKRPDHPDWGFSPSVTDDGRYLVITIWKSSDRKYRVVYKDLHEPLGMPLDLIDSFENEYDFVGSDGAIFYFETDFEAPRRRLIAIELRNPGKKHWKEIIPESKDTLVGVSMVGNLFVAKYLKDAHSAVRLFREDGRLVREVELPGIGSVSGFGGERKDSETFYGFSSFTMPPSTYRYDLITGESELLERAKVDFQPEDYEVEQVFTTSKDGTKVPMFLSHKKGIQLDGTNPTLLYGYGGFNISLTPYFSISRLQWMEMGGVFAMVNLRGGGEYGKAWHLAGTKLTKQNTFEDLYGAARWLFEKGYTRPGKLAIQGGSNGGLLVGAALTQHPEMFGACLPAVGVMDMLRYHKFTAGRFWVSDYGSSDNAEEFQALRKYSPYHNIKRGTHYPPTLITTADTDDRVVPGHSFKFAAALQRAQAGEAPVLIRIEEKAGHGAGTPTSKIIAQIADQWSFLVEHLVME